MKKYVLGFIVCPEHKKILLIRKLKPEFQLGRLNGVGGKIEEGENAVEAMIRETREETGLDILIWTNFAEMLCESGSKDKVSDSWSVECFITLVHRSIFYQWQQKEDEKLVVLDLFDLIATNEALLGNINWLVNMGIDKIMNNSPFTKPVIKYTGLSRSFRI